MISRFKLYLKHRHEKKLFTMLENMMKNKNLSYEMKDLRVPCANIYHYHTIPVVELVAPAYYANVYINMQTDMHGKVIAVQVNFGYSIDDMHEHEEDRTYSIPRDKVEDLLNTITDKMVTSWLAYNEGLG